MRLNKVLFIFYGLVLLLLPVFSASVLASFGLSNVFSLLAVVALVAHFRLPGAVWWPLTLVGAVWHDIYVLTPYAPSLFSITALGLVLELSSGWLTSRSYWTDVITFVLANAMALLVEMVVMAIAVHVFQASNFSYGWSAVLSTFVIATSTAAWLSSDTRRHLYIQ